MNTEHGHVNWNELMTRDVEAAKSFYADTLGWSYDSMPNPEGGTYYIAMAGGKPAAGLFEMQGADFDNVPVQWFAYIAVDDIDARLAKVADAGGMIIRPAFDIQGIGRIAVVQDKSGAHIGWITPAPPQA